MKKFVSAAVVLAAITLASCVNNSMPDETETSETSIAAVSETALSQSTAKKYETDKAFVETAVTSAETTVKPFDPAEAAELNTDRLLLTMHGWVYNDGIMDNSADYFLCILDDGTVYTMKYKTSESDTIIKNTFTDKLYSCDNSVWDLAENVRAVGNLFLQMNYEMLTENFAAIDWDSDYYERPYDEEVPAVDPRYGLITYLYPLKDGKKTAVFAESDSSCILDDNAAEFLRAVKYSDIYHDWLWQLWHFSEGDYDAEFNIYNDEQELYDAGVKEIYFSKNYPDIVSRIEGNYSTFKIFDSGDALRSIEQVKNFIGCKSAFEEFKHSGGYQFEQLYKGIPVYDGRITLTVDNDGYPTMLRSSYVPNIDMDVNPERSADIVYDKLKEMDVLEFYNDTKLYIVRDPESLEPTLARFVTVKVKENTWNGVWYEIENEKLYCFNANTGEFLNEYALSIPN